MNLTEADAILKVGENAVAKPLTLLQVSRMTACESAVHLQALGVGSVYLSEEQMELSLHQYLRAPVGRANAG